MSLMLVGLGWSIAHFQNTRVLKNTGMCVDHLRSWVPKPALFRFAPILEFQHEFQISKMSMLSGTSN